MVHNKKVLGVCGETTLANAKQSIITMMQVYEYFLSHHMTKAFESLRFGYLFARVFHPLPSPYHQHAQASSDLEPDDLGLFSKLC